MATTYTYFDYDVNMTDYSIGDTQSGNYRNTTGSKLITEYQFHMFMDHTNGGNNTLLARRTMGNSQSDTRAWFYENTDLLSSKWQLIPANSLYRKFTFELHRNTAFFPHIHNHNGGTTSCVSIPSLKLKFYNNKDGYGQGYATGLGSSSPKAEYSFTPNYSAMGKTFKLWGAAILSAGMQVAIELTYKVTNSSHSSIPVWFSGEHIQSTSHYFYVQRVNGNLDGPDPNFNTPNNTSATPVGHESLQLRGETYNKTETFWFTLFLGYFDHRVSIML